MAAFLNTLFMVPDMSHGGSEVGSGQRWVATRGWGAPGYVS